MYFPTKIDVRITKEIKLMIKKILKSDVYNDFNNSESMVIRAAIIYFYNSKFKKS